MKKIKVFSRFSTLAFLVLHVGIAQENQSAIEELKLKKEVAMQVAPSLSHQLFSDKDKNISSIMMKEPTSVEARIKLLPTELIVKIADYLSGKDFQNFSLSCKLMRSILGYEYFFVPEDKVLLIESIRNTHINNLDIFFFKFSRNLTNSRIDNFLELSSQFKDHDITPDLTKNQAQEKVQNLKTLIKMKRVLALANCKEAQDELISIKADKLRSLLTDLKDYYTANLEIAVQYVATQGLLVKHDVKNYLLNISRQKMFTAMNINIEEIIKSEEQQKDWIPLTCYYDDQF